MFEKNSILSKKRALLPMLVLASAFSSPSNATLTLLQPDPLVNATFQGNGSYSSDGLGQLTAAGGTIQAEVPAGSTVVNAYLYGTYYSTINPDEASRTIIFDGNPVVLDTIGAVNTFLATARTDVTSIVAAKVGGGGGITDFVIGNDHTSLDGLALVVIYENASLPYQTIAVLDGGASQTGDTATFNLLEPLDKSSPDFTATMALGIGFSFQGDYGPTHQCNTSQASTIEVNGQLISDCAGHYDDGNMGNGALITVGGVGDDLATPQTQPGIDDELYDIAPFLATGDTSVSVSSANPSQDDNLFLAIIGITAEAAVTTEICDNQLDDDADGLVDGDDPDCQVTPPVVEVCDNGIDDDGDGLVDIFDSDCPQNIRMTGGGGIGKGKNSLNVGFTLQCDIDAAGRPNRLQVNAGRDVRFHLEEATSITCLDDISVDEGMPIAGFDTMQGEGTGRLNGVSGTTVEWTFVDAGEPGTDDSLSIRITDPSGYVVIDEYKTLERGNIQAHP